MDKPLNNLSKEDKIYLEYKNNPEFKQTFTDVISYIPEIIHEYFPGITFSHYGRIKSQQSNHTKQLSNIEKGIEPTVYDNYAFKVVIKSVSDDYKSDESEVIEAQEKYNILKEQLDDRKKQLTNSSKQLEDLKTNYEKSETAYNNLVASKNKLTDHCIELQKNFEKTSLDFHLLTDKFNLLNDSINDLDKNVKSLLLHTLSSLEESKNNEEYNLSVSKQNLKNLENRLILAEEDLQTKHNEYLAQQQLVEDNKSSLEDAKFNLNMQKDSLHIAVSGEIANFLVAPNSPFLAKLNAKNIPERMRNYAKENGYVSKHRSISIPINSNVCNSCNIEMQFRSIHRDLLAKGNHDSYKKGKHNVSSERPFPAEEFRNCKTKEDCEKLFSNVPNYIIYNENKEVVECSPFINFYYFYIDHFKDNLDDFTLLYDNPLFDDTSAVIKSSQNIDSEIEKEEK